MDKGFVILTEKELEDVCGKFFDKGYYGALYQTNKNDNSIEIYKMWRDGLLKPLLDKQLPQKPEPPLNQIHREGNTKSCTLCGSSVARSGFLGIFGELLCINHPCPNSKTRKIYR